MNKETNTSKDTQGKEWANLEIQTYKRMNRYIEAIYKGIIGWRDE